MAMFGSKGGGHRGRPALRLCLRLGLAALCGCLAPPAAMADATPRDLLIIARALGFLERPPSGTAELGIVFPAESASGRAAAERIAATFGDGLRTATLVLRPRLVPLDQAATAPVVAFLLTDAALPRAGELAASVAGRGVPTISTDLAALGRGAAVMGVRSEPRVEILVSRAAAQAAGVSFSAAFRMMIQER